MKRAFGLALLALALGAGGAQAAGMKIGASAYGGYSYPIIQDDTGGGAIYGIRAPVGLLSWLTIEPFYASSNLGDTEETLGGLSYTRTGFDMTAFGASAILGSIGGGGVKFYPFAGIGSYKLERTGSEEIKDSGWNFGVGLGIPAGAALSLHVRGELDMIVTGDTSRKFGNVTLGLNYNFGLGGGGNSQAQSETPAAAPSTEAATITPPGTNAAAPASAAAAPAATAGDTTSPTETAPGDTAPSQAPLEQTPGTTPTDDPNSGGTK